MNAVEWVRECSEARGSARSLLWALAERAARSGADGGCVARCTAEEAIREGRLSRSELYKAMAKLFNAKELQRGFDKSSRLVKVKAFHLIGYCQSPTFAGFCLVSRRKQRLVSDLRREVSDVSKDDAEGCRLCRGSGWKLVPRTDGNPGNWAVACRRHVKQLQLVEMPEMSWAPAITEEQLWWRSNQMRGARPDGFRLEP